MDTHVQYAIKILEKKDIKEHELTKGVRNEVGGEEEREEEAV